MIETELVSNGSYKCIYKGIFLTNKRILHLCSKFFLHIKDKLWYKEIFSFELHYWGFYLLLNWIYQNLKNIFVSTFFNSAPKLSRYRSTMWAMNYDAPCSFFFSFVVPFYSCRCHLISFFVSVNISSILIAFAFHTTLYTFNIIDDYSEVTVT